MKNNKIIALTAALSITATGFVATNASAEKYTIQPGDTLYKISKKFDTTVESLKEINHLTSDLIFADDMLEVSSNGKFYIIEPGDTLSTIAAAHNVTVKQLQAWNGINTDLIYAGETLLVSGPSKEVIVATEKKEQKTTTQQATNSANTTPTSAPTTQATSNVAKKITVEATAYTAYCSGCSGVTTDGTNLRENPDLKIISVDPNVIPLGSKVWVEGYGEAIAADTGGSIKGNKIDVFIPSDKAANEWGRRTVTVKILN